MRNAFLALAFALLLGAASARLVAYFSPESSAFAINVQSMSLPGHYGNYTVSIIAFPPPTSVEISGPDESKAALVSEIEWLRENKVLESSCSPTQIANITSENGYYCMASSAFVACASPKCAEQALPPAAPQSAQGTFGKNADATAQGLRNIAQGASENFAKQAGAPAPQGAAGPSFEQLAQIAGALALVMIASYLILQQRQVQLEIDPHEERLLANETRAGIMQELRFADKIPTDLSLKLGKSKATIVEHLGSLSGAGFVEKLATPGRKFVYYRLTQKGKRALLRRAG